MKNRKLFCFLVLLVACLALAMSVAYAQQPEATAYRADQITVDGNLDEWNKQSPIVLADASQVVRDLVFWNGMHDVSATFYIAWDEANLYIAADVMEDNIFGAIEMLPLDEEDNIELFISTNPSDDPNRTQYSANDFMVYLVMDGEYWDTAIDRSMVPKENRLRFISKGMDGGENVLEGYLCAAKQSVAGFTFECRIPWACFSNENIAVYTPAVGDTINFNVLLTDISYPCPGTEYIPQIAWTGDINIKTNPGLWGRLTFQ